MVPIIVVAALLLSNCGLAGSSSSSPQQVGLQVTQPRSLGVGQSVVLTASAPKAFTPNWAICCAATNSVGTLSGQTGNSITYTAPAAPPIYSVPTFAVPQGQVQVQVQDTTGGQQGTDAQIVITAPSVTVAIDPVAARIIRNGPVYFTGYAVGAVNGAITWQVNGVSGGSTTYGTVTQAGVYTAPAAIPVGGVATVTVVSVADTTRSASAVVTIY